MNTVSEAVAHIKQRVPSFTSLPDATIEGFFNVARSEVRKRLKSDSDRVQTTDTVASQSQYQLPPDIETIGMVKLSMGANTRTFPLRQVISRIEWERLTIQPSVSGVPAFFFHEKRFGVGLDLLLLYPTPAAGYEVTIVYEAIDRKYGAISTYSTGTVALTNHSATVTGSGTSWNSSMIGKLFATTSSLGDGMIYRIASVGTPTSITLTNVYEGNSASGLAYIVDEPINMPSNAIQAAVELSIGFIYDSKGNPKEYERRMVLFDEKMRQAKLEANIVQTGMALSSLSAYHPVGPVLYSEPIVPAP